MLSGCGVCVVGVGAMTASAIDSRASGRLACGGCEACRTNTQRDISRRKRGCLIGWNTKSYSHPEATTVLISRGRVGTLRTTAPPCASPSSTRPRPLNRYQIRRVLSDQNCLEALAPNLKPGQPFSRACPAESSPRETLETRSCNTYTAVIIVPHRIPWPLCTLPPLQHR